MGTGGVVNQVPGTKKKCNFNTLLLTGWVLWYPSPVPTPVTIITRIPFIFIYLLIAKPQSPILPPPYFIHHTKRLSFWSFTVHALLLLQSAFSFFNEHSDHVNHESETLLAARCDSETVLVCCHSPPLRDHPRAPPLLRHLDPPHAWPFRRSVATSVL